MAAQFYKINYKSDFVFTINSDAGWAVPFCIKFWTGMPSHGYFAGFDGENYVNCRVGETPTQLLVMFDDHHMPVGPLRMQIAYHTTIEEFPDRKFDEVANPTNVTVDIDGTEYQVMLDFTGETGAEIDFSMPSSGVMSVNGKIGYVTLTAEDVGAQPTIEDLATIRSGAAEGATAVQPAEMTAALATKQDAIPDLANIRSGAAAGATAVQPATLQEGLATKQNVISDLATIRSGAAAGATAVQPSALQEGLATKQDVISDLSTIRSGAAAGATAVQPAAMNTALAAKQDTLTFDNTPTANSSNPVKSSGIKTALDAKQSTISTVNVTVDNNTGTPSGSASVSGSTLSLSFQNLKGATGATGATGPQGPQGERGLPGESGVTGDVSSFTVIQTINPSATYGATDIAGAATVQATNQELTELAGKLALGAVYDVSAENPTAGPNSDGKWETLSTLLSDANLNTLIPTALRKGGMSIKFIQSSDNKYVQFRYMPDDATTVATFINTANWQGVTNEVKAESKDLVESGGVAKNLYNSIGDVFVVNSFCGLRVSNFNTGKISTAGIVDGVSVNGICIPVNAGDVYKFEDIVLWHPNSDIGKQVKVYNEYPTIDNSTNTYVGSPSAFNGKFTMPSDAKYMVITCAVSECGNNMRIILVHDEEEISKIKDWILAESYTVSSVTRDSDGNVSSANVTFPDGIIGSISLTRNGDGDATVENVVYGSDTYRLTITRNSNGDVTATSLTKI